MRNQFEIILYLITIAVISLGSSAEKNAISESARPNVLFVMFEDMRPELPMYGNELVIAPNIERLARQGVVFDLAISQVGVCAPSRTSMLTGLRPDTLGVYDFQHFGGTRFFRSISSHFHRFGYQTSMSGKFQHWESQKFYSANYYGTPEWEVTQRKEMMFHNASVTPDAINERETTESSGNYNHFFRDSLVADKAIEFMEKAYNVFGTSNDTTTRNKRSGQPWFLAVGFKGTHMQYQMPKRFWDAYNGIEEKLDSLLDSIYSTKTTPDDDSSEYLRFPLQEFMINRVRKAESYRIQFMQANATIPSVESERYFWNRDGSQKLSVSKRAWKELYRGYLACLTYSDFQFGRILNRLREIQDEMETLNIENRTGVRDTIIVFTSDHGMHLGEKGMWSKWSLFEESVRVPLIVHDPRYPSQHGNHVPYPVELLDIFPTLIDLTGTNNVHDIPNEDACRKDVNFKHLMQRREHALLEKEEVSSGIDARMKTNTLANSASPHSQNDSRDGIDHTKNVNNAVRKKNGINDIGKLIPEELGDLRAIEEALAKEGKGENADSVFRHIYCDALEGTSLAGIIQGMKKSDLPRRNAFAITQRMTCKSPGHLIAHPQDSPSNASSGGWIEHCPNKRLPRVPAIGAMGYSLRYIDYRYTAWLKFNTDTYLPALNEAPLAEELYYHPPGDNLNLARVFKAELYNLASEASKELDSATDNSINTVSTHARKLYDFRKDLYNFLWYNATFDHLFHKRLVDQVILTKELKTGKRLPRQRRKALGREYLGITHRRVPNVPQPHKQLYNKHYFEA